MVDIMIIKLELNGEKEKEFLELKKELGVTANTEVINLALKAYHKKLVKKGAK